MGIAVADGLVTWDLSQAPGEPLLSKRLAAWERAARNEASRRETRDALFRPVAAEDLAPVQADLSAALAATPWAFGAKTEFARGSAEANRLLPGHHRFARSLLQDARYVVAAADRRLAEPAGQEALVMAEGRDADLLDACRILSEMDEDRARDANGRGWDAVSSPAGHRLAGREVLSLVEAGHAWMLVHRHRRQISTELRERLGMEA